LALFTLQIPYFAAKNDLNLSHRNSHILKLNNKKHANNTFVIKSLQMQKGWRSLRLKHALQTGSSNLMENHVSMIPFTVIWLIQPEESTHYYS